VLVLFVFGIQGPSNVGYQPNRILAKDYRIVAVACTGHFQDSLYLSANAARALQKADGRIGFHGDGKFVQRTKSAADANYGIAAGN
jgi:hypothetical protein